MTSIYTLMVSGVPTLHVQCRTEAAVKAAFTRWQKRNPSVQVTEAWVSHKSERSDGSIDTLYMSSKWTPATGWTRNPHLP